MYTIRDQNYRVLDPTTGQIMRYLIANYRPYIYKYDLARLYRRVHPTAEAHKQRVNAHHDFTRTANAVETCEHPAEQGGKKVDQRAA